MYRPLNYQESQLRVCVDSCLDREPIGRIYSPVAGHYGFCGILQMLGGIEELFNLFQYPQPTHETRTFDQRKKRRQLEDVKDHVQGGLTVDDTTGQGQTFKMTDESGRQATFVVSVRFRQNATWQGTIQWIEAKREQHFRSTLEMIRLMDDALSSEGNPDDMDSQSGWELV